MRSLCYFILFCAWVLLLPALFLFSCKTVDDNNVKVIDIGKLSPVAVNISQFTTGSDVVKLETSEDCLIGRIADIQFDDKFIYVRDAIVQVIYVFDRTGKFAGKLHKEGRGPGEYLTIHDFTVDSEEHTIEIFDGSSKKVLIYGLPSFNYIREISVPLSVTFKFDKKDGIYYFHTHGLRNIINEKKTNSDIIAFDPATKTLTPLFNKILPDEVNRTIHLNGASFENKKKQLFFSKAWHDQFYRIDKMAATPALAIDAGSHGVSERIKNGTYEQQEEYMNSGANKGQYLFFSLNYYDEEEDKIIVSFTNGTNPSDYHYYIRLGGQEYLTNKITMDFIDSKPDLSMAHTLIRGDLFVYFLMPGEGQSPEIENYIKSLNGQSEDNPVLILSNIK